MSAGGSPHRRLAQNVRKVAEHSAQRHAQSIHLGTVQQLSPFRVELHGRDLMLEHGVDMLVSQWVLHYHSQYGIQPGDNALVDRRGGVYVWTDVLSSTPV